MEILKTISIVDTPGTNTVIESTRNHRAPSAKQRSDNFVFLCPKPYTQTAWNLLSLIQKEWRKQVLFVMQQADRATAEELEINLGELRAQLGSSGSSSRRFCHPAKLEFTAAERGGSGSLIAV